MQAVAKATGALEALNGGGTKEGLSWKCEYKDKHGAELEEAELKNVISWGQESVFKGYFAAITKRSTTLRKEPA